MAVAASMLTAAYYILKDDVTYKELGEDYFERRSKTQITRHLGGGNKLSTNIS
jgi:hypothetical protein